MAALATLAIIIACLLMLSRYQQAPDVIMLGGLAALMALGIISPAQALHGFANEGIWTIAALYIVVAGLRDTGVVETVSTALLQRPISERRALLRLSAPLGITSALMNNTPVVALLIPVVKDWSDRFKLSAPVLLMPISFLAMAAGTITLLGSSTNLIANGLLIDATGEGLGLFELAAIGVPVYLATVAVLLLLAPVLLNRRGEEVEQAVNARQYRLEFELLPDSPLAGKTVAEAGLRHLDGVFLVEIVRAGRVMPAVGSDVVLEQSDRLCFVGDVHRVGDLLLRPGLRHVEDSEDSRQQRAGYLAEIVLSSSHPLIGRTIRDGRFRSRYGAAVLSVRRDGHDLQIGKIGDVRLQAGDTLLVEARRRFIEQYEHSTEFLLVRSVTALEGPRRSHGRRAIGIFLLMVGAAASGLVSLVQASWAAAALMVLLRCVRPAMARRSVDMVVIMVLAAAIGIGQAVQLSGLADYVARGALALWFGGSHGAVLIIVVATAALSAVLTNSAAVVLCFPVAMQVAQATQLSPQAAVVSLIVGATASFVSPIGYQTNLMVYGPGGYTAGDFLRMGSIVTAVFILLPTWLIPQLWPAL